MTDIVDSVTRSKMMSGIQGKNTKPEMVIRRQLHKRGFRFRVHNKVLPGTPDVVMRKYRVVIFVHGCFWHRHECPSFKWPQTRADFWRNKINGNHERDTKNIASLFAMEWRICVIWECAIKEAKKNIEDLVDPLSRWITGNERLLEIPE